MSVRTFTGKQISEEMTRLANREIELLTENKKLRELLQHWYLIHNTDYLELNRETLQVLPDDLDF